jgi:hypothetical protein
MLSKRVVLVEMHTKNLLFQFLLRMFYPVDRFSVNYYEILYVSIHD